MELADPVPDYVLQISEVEAIGSIAGRPILTWSTASGLTLTWSEGTLESTTDLGGTWGPVNGAQSPYPVPLIDAGRFFRLKK